MCGAAKTGRKKTKIEWKANIRRHKEIKLDFRVLPSPQSSLKVTDVATPLHLGTFCKASCRASPCGFHELPSSQLKRASFPSHGYL